MTWLFFSILPVQHLFPIVSKLAASQCLFFSFLKLIFLISYYRSECVAQISIYFLCQANSSHMWSVNIICDIVLYLNIIWCMNVHVSLSIGFFNWRQHSQIMVLFILGSLYITFLFIVHKQINSIIQWKAKKYKRKKVTSGKYLQVASWAKCSLLFFIQACTHHHLLTPKYRLLPYIPKQRTKKIKFQTKYEKMKSNYLFSFYFNFTATHRNAFNFSLYSLRNMNCECELNYATENVYNSVRECHQNFKNFLKWVFVFLDPHHRPLSSTLDPRPPSRRPSGPKNIARTNSWIKHITYSKLYLFKIKTLYLFKIFKKLFRKSKLWFPKEIERLFSTVVFFHW